MLPTEILIRRSAHLALVPAFALFVVTPTFGATSTHESPREQPAQESSDSDAKVIDAPISAVTVYPQGASIRRSSAVATGGGNFVVRALPATLDAESVRVRATGGEVVSVELLERVEEAVPEARLEQLREVVRERALAVRRLEAELAARGTVREHLASLFERAVDEHRGEVDQGGVDGESWSERLEWLRARVRRSLEGMRELDWRLADAHAALQVAQSELGTDEGRGGTRVLDLHLDLVDVRAAGTDPLQLEVEYYVGRAGWRPRYDVRAASDLTSAELVHHAEVWQQTGEDWSAIELALSTAEPERGTRAPEPQERWVGLYDPRQPQVQASTASNAEREGLIAGSEALRLERGAGVAAATRRPAPLASVSDEGLSVRLLLPEAESVESRVEPTRVLVGRAQIRMTPERYCVPVVDPTVWLRAKGRNTTRWVLFRGETAVYIGADFVGRGYLETARIGQELELDLGADPAVSVERVVMVDRNEAPGAFSKRRTWRRDWRVRLTNHGSAGARADGSVTVAVHEALPRSTDDKISVALKKASPPASSAERWKKLREEEGVLTWDLTVPRGAERTIELATEIDYPVGVQLIVN